MTTLQFITRSEEVFFIRQLLDISRDLVYFHKVGGLVGDRFSKKRMQQKPRCPDMALGPRQCILHPQCNQCIFSSNPQCLVNASQTSFQVSNLESRLLKLPQGLLSGFHQNVVQIYRKKSKIMHNFHRREYLESVHSGKQPAVLILQLCSIKSSQRKRAQLDNLTHKSSSQTSNSGKEMWQQYSQGWSHMVHVRHNLFAKSVSIVFGHRLCVSPQRKV